jgi:membrane fusion protein (multidrug efflux system)
MKLNNKFLGLLIVKGLFIVATSVIFTSCGAKSESNLDILVSQRDSLKTEIKKLNDLLVAVEGQIAMLDTTVNLAVVTVDSVKNKTFEHYFEIHGNVQVEENANVFPEAPGVVKKIYAKEGDFVAKGQLILALDAGPLSSNLKEIENALDLATKVFEKQSRLWEQKIGSEIQYLEAKNNKESLEKRLSATQRQYDMYTIKAPFDGIVDVISPKVGEMASMAMPAVRVINLSKVYIEAEVSESYLNKIKKGTQVKVFFPSLNLEMNSMVERIGDFINPANRTFKIRVVINNTNGVLKPNLLAQIKIRDFVMENAFVVPSKIIQQDRKGQNYFYSVQILPNKDAKVVKVDVETGMAYNNETIIVDGAEPGMIYIDKGARSVQEGEVVEVK